MTNQELKNNEEIIHNKNNLKIFNPYEDQNNIENNSESLINNNSLFKIGIFFFFFGCLRFIGFSKNGIMKNSIASWIHKVSSKNKILFGIFSLFQSLGNRQFYNFFLITGFILMGYSLFQMKKKIYR